MYFIGIFYWKFIFDIAPTKVEVLPQPKSRKNIPPSFPFSLPRLSSSLSLSLSASHSSSLSSSLFASLSLLELIIIFRFTCVHVSKLVADFLVATSLVVGDLRELLHCHLDFCKKKSIIVQISSELNNDYCKDVFLVYQLLHTWWIVPNPKVRYLMAVL